MRTLIGIFLLLVCAQAYSQGPPIGPKLYEVSTLEIRNSTEAAPGEHCVVITTPYPDGSMTFVTEDGGEVSLMQYATHRNADGRRYDHEYCTSFKFEYNTVTKKLLFVDRAFTHYSYHYKPRGLKE